MRLWLEQDWNANADPANTAGAFVFRIHNISDQTVAPLALCFSSMTRIAKGAVIDGAGLDQRFGNHHRLIAHPGTQIAPGEVWQIRIGALTHAPRNRGQGAMAAWLETADGLIELDCGDLQTASAMPLAGKDMTAATPPQVALLPWPAQITIDQTGPAVQLRPGDGLSMAEMTAIAALHHRLFPLAPSLLDLSGGRPVAARHDPDITDPEGFTLDFAPDQIMLGYGAPQGRRYGLIALAQMVHAAQTDTRFAIPLRGQIKDAPRFGWRGLHLDVARNFRSIEHVHRVVDIMAWHRLNRLHWHLTDDEGWRIEIPALPQLTRIGAHRGADALLPPQYADGPNGQSGFYSVAEARDLIARAATLGIEVIPEIDMPGHMTALLAAMPHLVDPDEVPDSYRSIQGYPNNALNPAVPAVYDVVETILDAICDIFPARIIHLGGDEVDAASWRQSPAAAALARAEGMAPDQATHGLQALFMRRAQQMLIARGRIMGGWDECAEGGGVDPAHALLFAWRAPEKTAELMALGYDVVATPGQAYYLDMAHDGGWDGLGATWAGVVPIRAAYEFEASDGLPSAAPGRLIGVQGGTWSESLDNVQRWNHMVFPRLSAIAEAGWARPEIKDFARFSALAPLMPQL